MKAKSKLLHGMAPRAPGRFRDCLKVLLRLVSFGAINKTGVHGINMLKAMRLAHRLQVEDLIAR